MEPLFDIGDFMPSEAKCVRILRQLRWGNGTKCPRCDSRCVIIHSRHRKHMNRYMCKGCRRTFTDTTGTPFEDSKMELREWFYIARELQRSISINRISKELGRKYDHVHRAATKIMDSVFMKRLIELSGQDIEVDGMCQSAGSKGTKQTARESRKRGLKLRGRGTYAKDKPPIVAAVERGGSTVIEVFSELCIRNLDAFLYFANGTFVHTDDYRIYDHLDNEPGIVHVSTKHSDRKYAECYKHSNTVEGMFGGLRTWLRRHKGVCKKNLCRFVSLFQFNYNNRLLKPMELFAGLLATVLGR